MLYEELPENGAEPLQAYLEEYIHPDQLDGELQLAPTFHTPPSMDYQGYHSYITDNLPPESPVLYGLHPNAEIGFLTATSEKLFRTVFELQPREGGTSGGPATTRSARSNLLPPTSSRTL